MWKLIFGHPNRKTGGTDHRGPLFARFLRSHHKKFHQTCRDTFWGEFLWLIKSNFRDLDPDVKVIARTKAQVLWAGFLHNQLILVILTEDQSQQWTSNGFVFCYQHREAWSLSKNVVWSDPLAFKGSSHARQGRPQGQWVEKWPFSTLSSSIVFAQ